VALFETAALRAYYGSVEVLRGVAIRLDEGEITSVIGPNGAGKSTLLKVISRLVRSEGEIRLDGESIIALSPREIVREGLIHCPEGRQLFPRMKVEDNLVMGAFAVRDRARTKGDLERVFTLFPILRQRRKQLAGTLSGGEQQMLAIGRGIMAQPKILMLDEPSLGLAPLVIEKIFEAVSLLNQGGLALLLVEQNAVVAMEVSHRTYVLEEGSIVREGDSGTLLKDSAIRESYLGMA
jgi:branched-chain amino acid transport system ATP-binding protein